MLREFRTKIEMAGEALAATITYERCPFDGHPIIHYVKLDESGIEIGKALKEWQYTMFEGQIEAAADAAIAAYKAERAEIDRRWRAVA